jgi:endonuclease YncB( thermonuclease family)
MARRYRRKTRPRFGLVLTRRGLRRLISFLLMLAAGSGAGLLLQGRVVSVTDGDSLTVFAGASGTEKVRLYGIDCPEGRQRGGADARAFTRSLALLEKVDIEGRGRDSYGRLVAVVALPDGRTLNEELVKSGHAWVYEAFCSGPRCAYWRGLEKQARKQKRGLWRDAKPLAPWIWRRHNR